ncbi:hypothetical protein ES703_90093 [subsurface metagenome]
MAKYQPWLKMWVGWVDDIKMLDLTLAEQGAWWRLVTLAKKCTADGLLVKDNGDPLSLDEIASTLRIKSKADRKVFDAMIQKMADQGSLHWDSNVLVVTNFAQRQARTTSETPEAVRDRVRLHRERQALKKNNPLEEPPPSSPLQPPNTLTSIDIEAEADVTSLHSVTRNGNSVTAEPIIARISKLHEENFGILTSNLSTKMKNFAENYRGPIEWVDLAFAEAVKYKNRRWPYVEAILYTWQEKGGPHADRKEPGGKKESPGTDQRGVKEPTAERYRQSLER